MRTEAPFRHGTPQKTAVLLVNLGTPDNADTPSLRRYLKEFLSDPRVVEIPRLIWWIILNCIILQLRPKKSAAKYATVWTDEGSPLIVITKQIQQKLQKLVDIPVEIGMRYAEPSIETGIRNLVEKGVEEIVLFPLYPQYAMSTTETVVEKAKEVQAKFFPNIKINYVKPFYNRDLYINCLAESIKEKLPENFDLLQFSYHGVPERHIYKTDPTKTCKIGDCCFKEDHPSHQYCYRHQCLKTTELVRQKLGLEDSQVKSTFQSRLGKDKWIEPYTDETLENRRKHIPAAEAIIDEIKDEFIAWTKQRKFAPTIHALKAKLNTIKEGELNFQRKKLANFDEEQAEIITARIIQKITNHFANHLKDDETLVDESIEWIEKIFQLETVEK